LGAKGNFKLLVKVAFHSLCPVVSIIRKSEVFLNCINTGCPYVLNHFITDTWNDMQMIPCTLISMIFTIDQ